MIIRHKGIIHERTEDAPFIGALICAVDCNRNCKNCFNQHLKDLPIQEKRSEDIIDTVKKNTFNEGVILGGLEWTEQPQEMKELIDAAITNELQVMLYTGMEEEEFKRRFPFIKGIWIKSGSYMEELKCNDNIQYGIKLVSKNQQIYKLK